MTKILWQSKAPVLFDSFQSGKLLPSVNGGNAFDFYSLMALKKKFNVEVDDKTLLRTHENTWSYWRRINSLHSNADAIIQEPYPVVFGPILKKTKQVAMIHHIDDEFNKNSLKYRWFFSRLKKRLRNIDLVITVSKHWENYFASSGCKKIKVIYNSFDPADYILSEEAIKKFKSNNGFNNDRPLIYIGNAQRSKGVYEVYDALRNSSYQLVMTGSKNNAADLPVKFLRLGRHDYLCLLQSSDLVITMSIMAEGWNRIAHEALLSKTPVIGSGSGGMKELLEGAGQTIVTESKKLPEAVKDVLKNKKKYSEKGFEYVRKFDKTYFENEWINTISDLLK
jgi:glycosyltransferase involved in cell wall biosynthesis